MYSIDSLDYAIAHFLMGLADEFSGSFKQSDTQLEKIKKKLQRLFKEYDLEIIAESNQKIVNYLDVTLNFKRWHF